MIIARRFPWKAFYFGFALCVLIVSFFVVRSSAFADHTDLLSLAVTFDVVLLTPGVYVLLALVLGWRKLTVIPIFVQSLINAHFLLPEQGEAYLKYVELALSPVELFLLVFVAVKVCCRLDRQLRKNY